MKIFRRIYALILGIFVLLTSSCSKDELIITKAETTSPLAPTCLVLQDSSLDYGRINQYFYNATNQVIRIKRESQSSGFYYDVLEYNEVGKLVKVYNYTLENILFGYVVYEYNQQGLISRINLFRQLEPGGAIVELGNSRFLYDALNRMVEKQLFSTPQDSVFSRYFKYYYKANGSIEENEFMWNPALGNFWLSNTTIREFDNKNNPFQFNKDPENLPLLSKNNLTSIKRIVPGGNVAENYTITYLYNAEGYPVKATYLDKGQFYKEHYFTYNCQ